MENKYVMLLDWHKKLSDGTKVYKIKALRDIVDQSRRVIAKKGDVGGFIQQEENLSQSGSCWVNNMAILRDNAFVCENAAVLDEVIIKDNSIISGEACIKGNSEISGESFISGICIIINADCMDMTLYGCEMIRGNEDRLSHIKPTESIK